MSVLDEALTAAHKSGKRFYEAELYRLKGTLTLKQCGVRSPQHPTPSTQSEAEECFRQAIDIARSESAKSWELRALISLNRLWQQQGKTTEARQILAEVCGGFTEGFDTVDLQEARALLQELTH